MCAALFPRTEQRSLLGLPGGKGVTFRPGRLSLSLTELYTGEEIFPLAISITEMSWEG